MEIFQKLKAGFYCPYVTQAASKRRVRVLNIERSFRKNLLPEVRNDLANLTDLDLWHNVDDIHVEDIELGEIPVEGFNEDIELEAVVILQQCCKDLVKEWSDRLTPNPLIRNAQELFTTDDWFIFGDE